MAITPTFCCGLECGVQGAYTSVNQYHWGLTGTGAFSTTTVRNGTRSFRINPTAGIAYITSSAGIGGARFIIRPAIYFATLPDADTSVATEGTTATNFGLYFKQSDSKLYAGYLVAGVPTFGATGVSVTTGVWYYCDILIDVSDVVTDKVDANINGTAVGQATLASVTGAVSYMQLGCNTTCTADIFYDDVVASATLADYPIGDGYVNHFVPTSDGTHNVAGAADFRRGGTTTDITNSTTDAYLLVDEVPLDDETPDTDDHIRIVAPANVTDYVELVFGPAPGISTPTVAPRAVEVIAEVFAAGTLASDEIIRLNDNGTVADVWNGTAVAGATTGRYKRAHFATAPTGGAWTVVAGAGNFNNIRTRYGYATDANPDKSLMCIMIEAEFAISAVTVGEMMAARQVGGERPPANEQRRQVLAY